MNGQATGLTYKPLLPLGKMVKKDLYWNDLLNEVDRRTISGKPIKEVSEDLFREFIPHGRRRGPFRGPQSLAAAIGQYRHKLKAQANIRAHKETILHISQKKVAPDFRESVLGILALRGLSDIEKFKVIKAMAKE